MKKQKHYRARYTPTGAGKAILRGIGVFHAIFGTVFALIGLELLFQIGLFGIPFVAAGAFFAVNGVLIALGKKGQDRSNQTERKTIVEKQNFHVKPPVETHDHIPSTALDTKRRLEQLETLKNAGLMTEQEYRQKRQEILKER